MNYFNLGIKLINSSYLFIQNLSSTNFRNKDWDSNLKQVEFLVKNPYYNSILFPYLRPYYILFQIFHYYCTERCEHHERFVQGERVGSAS